MDKREITKIFDEEYENLLQVVGGYPNTPIYWGGFNRRKKALGVCKYSYTNDDYVIELSQNIVRCSEQVIRDTIKHELGHALAGIDNGHNRVWKNACQALGLENPERCSNDDEFIKDSDYKWYLINTVDGAIVARYMKRPTRNFSRLHLKGRPETRGKLVVYSREQFEKLINDTAKQLGYA